MAPSNSANRSAKGGFFAYLATPYNAAGDVDGAVLADYAKQVASSGVAGVTCLASTCEGPYLTDTERHQVIEVVASAVAGRVGLNVGIGAASTRQAIELARRAEGAGATSLMLEFQQYFQVSFEAAREHYEAVAAAVRVPIRLYNLPRATRFDFTPQLIAAMGDIAAIRSVKDASGDVTRLRDIRALCGRRYELYCGLHYQALDGYQLGADGWEVMTHPLFTHRLVRLAGLLSADPWSPESRTEYRELQPLFLFFKEYGVPQSIKAISEWTELKLGRPRAPYPELTAPQKIRLRAIVDELELLYT
jgi:4-hydroxy-tetrahydrodipicolinate synthase